LLSSQNQSHKGGPGLGTLPHFSQHSLARIALATTLAGLAIFSLIQILPGPVRASGTAFSTTIINYSFNPQHISVTTGTQVIWTNNDRTQHTVTSAPQTNLTQGGGPLINSGPLSTGQIFSYTFYRHGFYPYQCSFHPYMTGWVNVTGSDVQPPSSPAVTPTDYTSYIIGGIIVATIVIASVVLFSRGRTKKGGSTPPVRST